MNRLLCVWMLVGLLVTGNSAYAQESDSLLVSHIEWSADGTQLLVALQEGGLYVVDPSTQIVRLALPSSITGPISDAGLQPGGELIATVDRISTLSLWNSRSGILVRSRATSLLAYRIDWSSDGQYLFTTNFDEMYMRDATGDPLFSIPGAPEDIPNVAFSPSGQLLLLSFSGKIEVWDVNSRQMLARNLAGGLIQSIQWSADGTHILAANISNTREGSFYNILVINVMTGESVHVYSGFPNQLESARWSPDETQIVATSVNGTAYLLDAASGSISPIFTSDVPLLSAAWSPYGGQIAIGAPVSSASSELPGEGTTFADVPVQLLVPNPSPERLQAIAAACDAPPQVVEAITAAADRQAPDTLRGLTETVEALPDGTIPPACAADLIAVAEALTE